MRFGIFGHYLGLCISITLSWKRVSSRVKRNALDFTQLAEKKEQKRYLNRVWGKRPEVFVLFPVELSSFSPILTLAKSMTKLPRAYVLPFFSALAPLLLQDWPVFWVLYTLGVQGLRICLAMLETWIPFLIWEDPTCPGAVESVSQRHRACVLELMSWNYGSLFSPEPVIQTRSGLPSKSRAPQSLWSPTRAVLPSKSHTPQQEEKLQW